MSKIAKTRRAADENNLWHITHLLNEIENSFLSKACYASIMPLKKSLFF